MRDNILTLKSESTMITTKSEKFSARMLRRLTGEIDEINKTTKPFRNRMKESSIASMWAREPRRITQKIRSLLEEYPYMSMLM